jgi:hypothetical protein
MSTTSQPYSEFRRFKEDSIKPAVKRDSKKPWKKSARALSAMTMGTHRLNKYKAMELVNGTPSASDA